ncbi:uncharacterized protein LOC124538031 [Vanessa cardui]|uniref:uncharacterized protein LOC124538031 n=1 Tax=Vanessa cardui TaxID=171605 RepID=UPI001F13947E|nr:uncharacterized protein LOC124538031 [Vanessa cardui]
MEILTKLYIYILIWIRINAESSDDDNTYTSMFNPYSPTSVNFQDIFTNTLILSSEDSPTVTNDEDLVVSSLSTQYTETHPKVKLSRTTPSPSSPPPKKNTSYVKSKKRQRIISTTYTSYIEEPDEITDVKPVKTPPKGVLDVLFPAARVKSFKNVFNSFKRLLSQTLRRR